MKRTATVLLLAAAGCAAKPAASPNPSTPPEPAAKTPADAHAFVTETESALRELVVAASVAEWEKSTNITEETEATSARADEKVMAYLGRTLPEAARYRGMRGLSDEDARKLTLLLRSSELPAPSAPALREELAQVAAKMDSMYGKGKVCQSGDGPCQNLDQLSDVLAASRDYARTRDAFAGWHDQAKSIRPLFERYVTLANQGARELGYHDLGELWRSRYDMPPDAFEAEYERLWNEVKPLYEALHCHVRKKLRARYGADKIPQAAPIPAHLLGNMWAQDWTNLYKMLEPYPGRGELDVSKALVAKKVDPLKMVKHGESFFTSLGLPALPTTFWERSMFVRPKEREVICHASAWDVTFANDLRIKMCIKQNHEDLITIHHELGHIYYFTEYYQLPFLFQDGANEGFHEAIGDTIALSITPAYLKQIGLITRVPAGEQGAINQLMMRALEKVAFLPFGKVVDEWRWKVFAGDVAPSDYNQTWWALRRQVQGVAPDTERPADGFDPGAKYHVPANVPYARYFIATVLQYQLHRALCKASGHTGPLYACSIYGNRAAGERLEKLLALGASKPWPDALEVLSGERKLDATAIVDYYAPLMQWLDKQNQGEQCGWSDAQTSAVDLPRKR